MPRCTAPCSPSSSNSSRSSSSRPATWWARAATSTCYHTFTKINWRFIALDSNTLRLGRDASQLAWLRQTLAEAKEPNLFVYLHHPPYAIGSYAPGDLQVRRDLEPLFRAHPPRAVFCGHDHSYYRTTRHGIPYVVTAGGGAPLYEPQRKLMQPGDVSVKNYHGCEVTVEEEQVRLRAIQWDGKVIDDVLLPSAPAPVTAAR
ncbi:MAG: metallophosphoesterase [Armatimonadetes bacterium]|nr:metallophosphoesterase [Armatimonadota bacterium]